MAIEKQRKTFISYSRVNKDFAVKLAKELKAEGFTVWLDQLDIPAGARWDVELEKALEECEIFMIIMTPASIASENVRDEIGYAIDNGKRFLPVLLENCNVPLRLRRFQYVDFTTKTFDDGVESAKDLLRNLINENTQTIRKQELAIASQEREAQIQAELEAKAEEERSAEQKADREAKAEAERLAQAKAESERKAKEETEQLAKQKADREAKAEAERLAQAKAKSERKAKQEADRLAAQKAEADIKSKKEAEEERLAQAKSESERKAQEETEQLAKQKADSEAKAEAERLAKAKAETERKAKQEADRLAAQKAEAERKAKAKPVQTIPAEMTVETVSVATTEKKSVSKGLIIGIVAVAVLVVAGIGYSVMSRGGATPATEALVIAEPATEAPVATETPTVVIPPTETETPSATSTPTEPYVVITGIRLDGKTYVVDYEVGNFTETLHVHMFFNTVPQDQAGSGGSGPWKLTWGRYGDPPFTQYGTANRPAKATQMCALVANSNHTIRLNTGNCVDLPPSP